MIVHDLQRVRLAEPLESSPVGDAVGHGVDASVQPRLGGLRAGTGMLTPSGYRPIEQLRRSDLVATLLGRGPMFVPVAWIGWRRIAMPTGRDPVVGPVRVRRDAIADGMPTRDVVLAPDHALYLEGALYMVRQLVNGATLLRDLPQPDHKYWAIQLERHDVVCADGMAVETLLHDAARAAYTEAAAPRLRLIDPLDA
jgi:hypothetical protein